MTYLLIGTVGRSRLTGVGLAGSGTTVHMGNGGDCQEHGIFKLFITRSFHELFLLFLMFECFTLLILHSHHSNETKRTVLLQHKTERNTGTWLYN